MIPSIHFAVVITFLYDNYVIINAQENRCFTTKDSKHPMQPCIFPFTHQGVTYNGCPPDPFEKDRRWCSTQVINSISKKSE